MIALPDLLHATPRVSVDNQVLRELLELGFLGKETGSAFDRALSEAMEDVDGWQTAFFAEDLFLGDLVAQCFRLELDGHPYKVNQAFLYRVLATPPTDRATIDFRQDILREIDDDDALRGRVEALYVDLYRLLGMFKVPGHQARLDINSYRLDLLRQAKRIVDTMVTDFAKARSGLRRLHDSGLEIRESRDYKIMAALLDYEENLSSLNVDIRIGGDGRITGLQVRGIEENTENRFYGNPARRWWDRLRFAYRGYKWSNKDVVSRLVHEVFLHISPSFTPLIQITGHLELYLTTRAFREAAAARDLDMALATFDDQAPLDLDQLFNPLLLEKPHPVVPNGVVAQDARPTIIITGPNSGGKTRLLQAVGIAQVLGQSGLYVPARGARIPLVSGMFVSLIERDAADHNEGRLGRELIRIRAMFEAMQEPAMVVFDELCSGTNPSEGIEVFSLVLRLLEKQRPVSLISTHFLDFARDLAVAPPVSRLEFLQVEVDDAQRTTFQFVPGVASTSLAAATAKRLGVTFEELSRLIEERRGRTAEPVEAPDPTASSPAVAVHG